MDVFLTGGTGLIGSALLSALLAEGHTVRALARSDTSAAAVEAAGATAVRGDLTDVALLAEQARQADGVVHTASPGDATSAEVDGALLDAVLPALAGSGKPYVHTSGVWVHGSATFDETSPLDPPALTAWRVPLDARVRAAAADGVRSVLIGPGIVHGNGGGLPGLLVDAPKDAAGARLLPGSGEQHWTTVHVDDLARLYVLALQAAAPGSYYLGVSDDSPTVAELGAAASRGAGDDGRVAGSSPQETADRLGLLGEALLLDQRSSGAAARADLGWAPTGISLVEDLERGSYAG